MSFPAFPASGCSVDIDFTSGQYYSSDGNSSLTDQFSISRASVGYAKNSAGVLVPFASDKFRITDLGLLIEDTRTNIVVSSGTLADAGAWSPNQATVVADQATAPDGTLTMTQIVESNDNNVHYILQTLGTTSAGVTLTFSIFVKDVNRRYVALVPSGFSSGGKIFAYFDLSTGTVTDSGVDNDGGGTVLTAATIEAYGNGIYRLSCTGILSSTDVNSYFILALSDRATHSGITVNGMPSYQGSTSNSIYAWGAQMEPGAFPSSYIPTTTTAATRAADVVTITGNAQTAIAAATGTVLGWLNGAGVAGTAINLFDSNGTNLLGFDATNHGLASLVATLATGNTSARTSRDKLGLAWDGSGRSLVLNGGTVATDASAQTPSSTLHLGSSSLANFVFRYVERVTVWTSKVADATLQALTVPSYGIVDVLPILTNTMSGVARGVVTTGASTHTIPTSALTIYGIAATGVVAGQFSGQVVIFDGNTTTAGLRGTQRVIRMSSGSNTPLFTVDTLPATPTSGDTFSIV